jgi:O-antigen/teichoic acid export membrane protein
LTMPSNLDLARRGQSTRLINNSAINAAGSIAFYVAVVMVTPMAIGGLGDRMWGIWQLVGSLTSYALLINLGLNGAVSYHVSNAVARDDAQELGAAIHHAWIYFAAAGALIAAVFLIAGRPLIFHLIGGDDAAVAYRALVFSAILTGLTLPIRVYPSVLSGLQRYDAIAMARVAGGAVLVMSCGVGFFFDRMGLISFVILMTIAPIIPGFISWMMTRRILPREMLGWHDLNLPFLKEMLSYSINTVAYTAGSVVLFQSMKVMAAWKAGGPVAAGHIGLVVNIAQILSVVFIPLVAVLHPRVRDLASRGMEDELPRLLRRSLTAAGFVIVPTVLFTTLEAPLIFEAWVGNALSPETINTLSRTARWMMIGQGPFILFLPCFYALVGLGEHRIFGLGMLAAGVVNAILGWALLSQHPDIESLGMAFGGTLAALVFLVTVPATLRRFQVPYWVGLRDAVLWPTLVAAPGALAFFIRPDFENAKIELIVAAILFGVCIAPGLLVARLAIARKSPGTA